LTASSSACAHRLPVAVLLLTTTVTDHAFSNISRPIMLAWHQGCYIPSAISLPRKGTNLSWASTAMMSPQIYPLSSYHCKKLCRKFPTMSALDQLSYIAGFCSFCKLTSMIVIGNLIALASAARLPVGCCCAAISPIVYSPLSRYSSYSKFASTVSTRGRCSSSSPH
jgi:hypothetical protein